MSMLDQWRERGTVRVVQKLLALGALSAAGAAALNIVRSRTAHRRPRPVPRDLLWGEHRLQLPGDGVGKLFHRRYSVLIEKPQLRDQALMERIKADLPEFSPRLLADFRKIKGHSRRMAVGDEYQITIFGPWNGNVSVVEVTPTSFTLVTLEGHPEAGQITFALTRPVAAADTIRFEINSWARSRDFLVSLGYEQARIGKEIQKNVWVTFCENVVAASGGVARGQVEVVTEERAEDGEVIPIV